MCGCEILEDLRRDPGEMGEAEARGSLARTLQARWGCRRAGKPAVATLPIDLAEAAEDHARVTGAPPCGTCPFSRPLTPWALQVLRLDRVGARGKGTTSARDILGRPPHAWDVAGLDALACAAADVSESDDAIRERERKANQK